MFITRVSKPGTLLAILLIGGLLSAPLFAQSFIDLTDGICSHRFLQSAEEAARTYYDELGVPENLADLIDSSYYGDDQISAVFYIYIAHQDEGLEEIYLADLARTLSSSGCYYIPESLFIEHLVRNPRDNRAIGDYALLLARRKDFSRGVKIIEDAIDDSKRGNRKALYRDLGIVRTIEYLDTDQKKALEHAFEAFRMAKFGKSDAPTDFKASKLSFDMGVETIDDNWRYSLSPAVKHILGSDAIILRLCSEVAFGREIQTGIVIDDLLQIRDLFGTIYIAPGESLTSLPGALEISTNKNTFLPFYDGLAGFSILAVFPGGGTRRFNPHSEITLRTDISLMPLYDILAYGEYARAGSILTAMSESGSPRSSLPLRWEASVKLSAIMNDPALWESGLRVVDSLINVESDQNLWVYKGALFYLLGQPGEAIYPLKQAIVADSMNFWAIYNLALVEYDLGNKERAADLFLKTARINKRMFVANLLAGVIFEELGQIDRALEQYNLALRNVAFRSREIELWIKEIEGREE